MRSLSQPTCVLLRSLALGLVCAGALAGCGSGGTTTVTVSSATSPQRGAGTTSTTDTTPRKTPVTPRSTSGVGQTPSPSETRTESAPAFTDGGTSSSEDKGESAEGLPAALATIKARGFTASDTSDYHPQQTLRVLIGTKAGSGNGYAQQAFFFVDGHYIGTDSSEPSATLKVVSQSDTEVTLAYPLYHAQDPLCCPGGGQADVRFQLNNGHLMALGSIPPVSSHASLSRR